MDNLIMMSAPSVKRGASPFADRLHMSAWLDDLIDVSYRQFPSAHRRVQPCKAGLAGPQSDCDLVDLFGPQLSIKREVQPGQMQAHGLDAFAIGATWVLDRIGIDRQPVRDE
jgi:hypothetical protein